MYFFLRIHIAIDKAVEIQEVCIGWYSVAGDIGKDGVFYDKGDSEHTPGGTH